MSLVSKHEIDEGQQAGANKEQCTRQLSRHILFPRASCFIVAAVCCRLIEATNSKGVVAPFLPVSSHQKRLIPQDDHDKRPTARLPLTESAFSVDPRRVSRCARLVEVCRRVDGPRDHPSRLNSTLPRPILGTDNAVRLICH